MHCQPWNGDSNVYLERFVVSGPEVHRKWFRCQLEGCFEVTQRDLSMNVTAEEPDYENSKGLNNHLGKTLKHWMTGNQFLIYSCWFFWWLTVAQKHKKALQETCRRSPAVPSSGQTKAPKNRYQATQMQTPIFNALWTFITSNAFTKKLCLY